MTICIVILVLLWIFQVLLLESLYLSNKQSTMMLATGEIVEIFSTQNTDNAIESLRSISGNNNYCIEIYDYNTAAKLSVQPVGSDSLFTDENIDIYDLIDTYEDADPTSYLYEDYTTMGNTPIYITAQKFQDSSMEFSVFVASTLAPVHEAVQTIQSQLIIFSFGIVLLAIIIAIVVTRSLTTPVLQISRAAQKISSGDTDVKIKVKTKDEIGRLADDFNTMTTEISRVSKLQKELVANVSHDLRTPLTMIKGYAETIKDLTGENKEKRDKQLDIIIEETNRLDLLLTDILDLSKIQSGQLTLDYTEFDLAQKLKNIIRRYDLLTQNEDYHFHFTGPENVVVYADEVKIEQVIYNILNNAVNHTGADKSIFIDVTDFECHVIVKIRDTGAGILPENLPLIWDRYYKPFKKHDRTGMGSGLGLSIVKGILLAHDAKYGVDSKMNEGSTFWFEVKKGEVE